MITSVCGCVVDRDPEWGVWRNVYRCDAHLANIAEAATRDPRAHYESMGVMADGMVQCRRYADELRECVKFPVARGPSALAYEIGCGCSMYAPTLMRMGYSYLGIEPCEWAAEWTRSAYDVPVIESTFENFAAAQNEKADLILAAHCFEHMEHAPEMIARAAEMLKRGGELIIIVPDDEDKWNPDHFWFFEESTLRTTMTSAGLRNVQINIARRIERESFLYARGMRP